jgi:hypothetical protein
MSGVALKVGSGPHGLSVMKFTLIYDGDLKASGKHGAKVLAKWEIRKQLHPQLKSLWATNPVLIAVNRNRLVPTSEFVLTQSGAGGDTNMVQSHRLQHSFKQDVCATLNRGSHEFIPLVRDSLDLKCGLKIIFLRREEPGRIYQAGDLDNRLKTLFDALSVPNRDQIIDGDLYAEPIYCLLEDDRLISRIDVDTQQLLREEGGSKHEVRLVIEVDVRIIKFPPYNSPFLGE